MEEVLDADDFDKIPVNLELDHLTEYRLSWLGGIESVMERLRSHNSQSGTLFS